VTPEHQGQYRLLLKAWCWCLPKIPRELARLWLGKTTQHAVGRTRFTGCKGEAVLLHPQMHPASPAQSQPPPTAPSQHHQPTLSQAGTQASLLRGSQFPPFHGFVLGLNSSYTSRSPDLCFAISHGSGVSQQLPELSAQQCSAALSRDGRNAHRDIGLRTLQEETELGSQRFPLAPGQEKWVPQLAGLLRHGWDLGPICPL